MALGPTGLSRSPEISLCFGRIIFFAVIVSSSAAAARRRREQSRAQVRMVIAPLLILAACVALTASDLALKLRFGLSLPAFNSLVDVAGQPNAETDTHGFPARCPARIGLYSITTCDTVPTGYVFYDNLGSGIADNAGFAYLPSGVPENADTSSFESPRFTHIRGSWYSFTTSW
ncbi:hypothetical protein [Microlunatus soli]|uniref:Uncharacterized protein n=1 Tax=Microlunatus soli TaxID=630515 RepID=A0A1H1NKR8_9ACTN|nr:hypothetical protein [Microlunatus soli]SDR99606.1 hypothetical protein SAMN04489812_0553 [Microlunatus soli]